LTDKESLFRAVEGDIESLSTVVFWREGTAGTANVPDLSVFDGPVETARREEEVPVRL